MPAHGQAQVEERTGFKVALVRVPGPYSDWNRHPTLGLACLCAYLKANGLGCKIFDARYHLWTTYELVRRVKEYGAHLVGLTAMTHEIKDAARIAQRFKAETSAPVIVGGPHTTALPKRTLTEFPIFDYGISGDGEKPLLGLAARLKEGYRNVKYIAGVIHRDKEEVTINARAPALTPYELDALPFPDFDDYYGTDPGALRAADACCVLAANRGTSNNSPFTVRVPGREMKWRSPENVLREVERAIFRWGAHTFDFCNEGFVCDAEEPRKILETLAGSELPGPVRWSGAARLGLISPEIVNLAKRAGCFRLRLDVGSGDDDILAATGGGVTRDIVKADIGTVKAAGIEVELYFMLGHPGETEEQVRRTVGLVAELNPDRVGMNLIIPYPGTGIYEMALRGAGGYRVLSDDWSRYAWYGGKILDLEGLPYRNLARWQRRAVIDLYLKNRRPLDFLRYLWVRRTVIGFLVSKKLGIRLVTKERFTG